MLSMVVIFTMMGVTNIQLHQSQLMDGVYQNADQISDLIKRGTNYSMMQNERDRIFLTINYIAQEPGIQKVRIYNKDGQITFSSDETEEGQFVDMQAEACIICHSKNKQPEKDLPLKARARDYYTQDNKHVLGVISPIKTDESCVNASCHAHSREQQVLGVLDVILSLDQMDAGLSETKWRFMLYFALSLIAISLVSVLFIFFMVHRPVNKIVEGTRRVADGDLNVQVNIQTKDEIGWLSQSFNKMTKDLDQANHEITKWTHTLEDQVRERTAQLKQAQESVIQSEKMASVGRLAAIVAHEINNPMAGIRTCAKLLMKKILKRTEMTEKSDLLKHLEIIDSESTRCGDIVKNLLQFSRPSQVKVEKYDLNLLITQSVRLIKHQADLMGAEIRLLLFDQPLVLECDTQKIKQALVAILINSCDALLKDHGMIEITSREMLEKDGVEFSVIDNGVGMDAATRERIFEPFFTTKNQNVKGGTNIGMGLSVVFEIIESHGGKISVHSEPGRGSKFVIFLPKKHQHVKSEDHDSEKSVT